MVEIKNTRVYGLYNAIVTSGFPMRTELPEKNSWSKWECCDYDYIKLDALQEGDNLETDWNKVYMDRFIEFIGQDFFERRAKLGQAKPGSGHDNFLKGIRVVFDLKYSLYFTKQLQRYHFIDFISSQSTMHKLTSISNITKCCNKYVDKDIIAKINTWIDWYNRLIKEIKQVEASDNYKDISFQVINEYGETITYSKYDLFMMIVSNLPCGYEQWAGMETSYLQLKTIYTQRRFHKLKEDWGAFCDWIETLPMFKELCLKGKALENTLMPKES